MPNENLVKLYTTLTTPNQALGGKAFFTPESLGGSADVFAEKLKDRANLEKLFTTITSPSDALGGKAFFTPESLGGNANVFAEKIGFGAQKKNPIGSESTSGSEPFQNKMLGGGVKINPFQPVSAKPIESTKFDPSVIRNIAGRDKKLAGEATIKTMTSNIAATPRYVYDWTKLAVEKAASLASPTGETGMVLPTFDQVREMTRSSEPNALNSLDYLDKLSKTAAADAEALSQKISTNKLSYIDLFKEGKFGTFIDKTANDLILSAPSMALMTVSPAAAATAFGAGRNLELTDNDTLPADLRLTNSFFTGLSEVFLEGKIGGTALLRNITMQAFKEGGEKAAKEVVNKATRDIMAKYAKKMYGASKDIFLSGVEEATTDFIQQVTDYYTGVSDKIDLTRTMEAAAGGLAAGTGIKALGEVVIKPAGKAYKKIKNLNTKASAISQDLDNPNIPNETKSVLQDELIKTNEEAADVAEAQKNTITNLTPTQQKSLDAIAVDMGNMEALLEDPNLSPETKATFQTKLDELQAKADAITSRGESIEYVSEGDNFFKILLDGTKEPVTEAEFDQAVSTTKPINEKNGDMVTVNFGGKAITGTVEVDEGGKASIYSGGVVYELPNDTEYVDYASPVRISDVDGSIEFDGVSYPEVRIESINGTETAVLIDENGKPKTVKDPKIVEEFKYQITLANLAEITEEEAITLLSEYEQDSKTKVDDATEGGVNQADEQKRSEEDIKLQEAIDEIDLIELIALEELDNADANAKLVEYKPTNSKDTKVYLVKKNADGTVSATLDGKKVRRGAVLSSLSEAYDLQSREGSKKLATKLQEQVNALKADVEAKLFGKAAVDEMPVVEQPKVEEPIVKEEQIIKQEDATKESSQQVIQGDEQGSSVQRQRANEGQQKAGERKGDERKAKKPKADRGDSIKQSREEQEKVTPKKDDSKPTGLSPLETKFKETPEALSKDELKEVLDTKRERYKKAMATIEKGDLEGDALKAKQKAVDALENTIEDLVKRIDAGVNQKIATKEQAIGVEEIPVKSQTKIKKSLDSLKAEFSNNETKIKVIEAVEKGISVLQSAFPSMNIVIHKSSSDFLEATGLPMVNGKVASGVFMYSGDAKLGYEGVIHIDLTNANPTVVYHEIAHALILKTLGENQTLFESFKNKVSKILSEKTAANLDAFIDPYPQSEKAEEYIVQLAAALAATKSNTNPSILMKLKVIINDLVSKITGGKIKVFAEEAEGIEVYDFLRGMAATIKEGRDIKDLQKYFNNSLLNPTVLNAANITISDVKSIGESFRVKKSIDGSKTPEQMVQSMREDKKFSNAIIDFAYLSIKLKGLKTIDAFKNELGKQLGVKFDKMPQELKDVWNEAKKKVVDEKKQASTVKQTIKEATEQKTSPEKVATFAEYMAAKYKGMAEGEKIGQKNRFEIIKEAARYVKQAVVSDVSRAKINSLINKAISIQNFDSVKSFAKYVDKLIENQEYYAKVAELEGLAAKLGSKVKADKFGSIAPQIRRMLSINPEHLTEEGIDKYIALAKDLLSGKVADVTNLESTLAQLKAEERQTIEARLTADLMDDAELISLIDTMYKLLGENPSKVLEEGLKEALPKETADDLKRALEKVNNKRAEIMEFITGNKMIKTAKDYAKLVAAVKKYNGALTQLLDAGIISSAQKLALNINPEGKDLSLLEEALKEKLDDFRKSLADQIMTTISSIKNQYLTGGIRAKLFANLSSFDKKAYEPVIKDILTIPKEVLPDLTIDQLDDLFNAVDQLSNGYISPKVMELLEVIESKGYQNSIAKNADPLYDKQVKSDGIYNSKISPFLKSISDFKSGASALADFMKTFDYKEISSFLSDGFTQIYGEYIYKPFERAFTTYKNVLEDVSMDVVKADDAIKYNKAGNTLRNVVGIFLIQADHLRNPEYKNWSEDKKNLPKYILGEYKNRKANISQKDIELLEAAMNSIEGDISTRQGLDDAMNKYFAKNPKAKALYNAIRNSIDNNIAPMTKIAIEREGGFFDPDQDYFPIQRRGTAIQESENPFEDLSEKQYSKDFKRRANATYRRIGDPFVMRDFNATSAFNNLAEEASRNYALKPVVNPYNRAIDELVAKYDKEGKKDLSIFLEASKDVIHTSMKMQFQREQATRYSKFLQESMSYMRGYLLAQVWRLVPDLVSNVSKAMTSMNPIEYAKYAYKQKQAFDNDSFTNLAKLTSSPIIFKTSRAKMENLYSNKRVREKKLDTLAGWADVLAATTTWKALMMKNFKEITGKDLDVERLKNDAEAYYLENEEALDKAAYRSDLEIDKRFVTQSEIGRAPMQKILPFLGSGENLKGYTVERTSKTFSILNMMASYMANDARVLGAASRRLITKGDVKGFTRDVTPILLSQAVYAASISYASALASTAGYAIMSIGGDDDDEILAYFTEEINNANKIFTDPQEFAKAYAASLTMMAVGRYMAMSKIAAAFGIGIYASLDVLFAEDKKEKKEDIKKWKENFSVIKDQFYFSPITYGIKDKSIQTTGLDVLSITPVLSFYNRELEKQFTPDKNGSVLGAMKEFGKKGGDDNLIGMGVLNLGMLVAIRAGAVFAPSFIKTINEANKTKARKDWEENKKKGGKSNQTKNPFGSSGFGSGGLKGGL